METRNAWLGEAPVAEEARERFFQEMEICTGSCCLESYRLAVSRAPLPWPQLVGLGISYLPAALERDDPSLGWVRAHGSE